MVQMVFGHSDLSVPRLQKPKGRKRTGIWLKWGYNTVALDFEKFPGKQYGIEVCMVQNSPKSVQLSALFRKTLILPTEHGSWAWLLVPFAVGTAVAQTINLPVMLALVAALAAFLLRQPATVWLRVRRGKARRADGPLARTWMLLLGGTAVTCGLVLLFMGRFTLLWLGVPLIIIFVLYLLAARYGRTSIRSLGMEVSGAAALAMTAPAAYIAGAGQLDQVAAALWLLMAAQNVLGALYVRVRIADTHQRPTHRSGLVLAHFFGFLLIAGLGLARWLPWLTAVPFAAILLRALWAARQPRPVPNVKRFGFLEMGVEILSGAWIAYSQIVSYY